MKRIALFPGSFDPLTVGHLELIERLSRLYDQVVVGVLHNPAKKPFLPVEARLCGIRGATAHLDNVTVCAHDGATVELAKAVGAQVIARGLRSVTDFEYESQSAAGYYYMAPQIETVFLPARPEQGSISSSLVRDIFALGGDVSALVPPAVARTLEQTATPKGEVNA